MTPHALISGGSSGIGLALARRLAAAGWNITILARSPERLEAARAEIAGSRAGIKVRTASVDVRDEAVVQAAVQAAIAALGAPELVVASAGIVIPGLFTELSSAAFRETLEVNYCGSVYLVRAALPDMRARRAGRIVLISSGAGLIGLYGYTAYAPTKFAVRGFAEALRGELIPDGVAVSIVFPPDTDTPQLREEARIRPEATSRIAGGARVHTAEEVADAILAGIRSRRFVIAPGWEMGALARLHSLIAPVLNRFSFDPVIAKYHGGKPKPDNSLPSG